MRGSTSVSAFALKTAAATRELSVLKAVVSIFIVIDIYWRESIVVWEKLL